MKRIAVVSTFVLLSGSSLVFAQAPTEPPPPPPMEAAPPPVAPAPAPGAGAAGGFGQPGQWVASGDLQLDFTYNSQGDSSWTDVVVQPAIDYFIAPNISVGGLISFARLSASNDAEITVFGVGVRGGLNLPITSLLSFWPRLGLQYDRASTSGIDGSASTVSLGVFAPVLVHLAPNFFIGAGPTFSTDLMSSFSANGQSMDLDKATRIGISSLVGGYFSL